MSLDLTVIVAQIVNFAVLVWLLNRFLYRPVRSMIQAREDRFRQRMEQVLAREAEAEQALATYQELQAELERERGRLLEQAREEARRERSRLMEAAAQEAQQARRQWAEALQMERMELASSIQENLVRQVCDAAGRVVSLLGGTSLADAIISTLEARWDPQEGADPGHPGMPDGKVVVRTSFPLTPEQKARLARLVAKMRAGAPASRHTLKQDAGQPGQQPAEEPEVQFQVDPRLLLGVEVEMGGTVTAWSAREILDDLQKDALAALATAPEDAAVPPQRGEVGSHA